MGIENLWKLLEPVAEHISLHQLAIEEGFVNNSGGVRALMQVGYTAHSTGMVLQKIQSWRHFMQDAATCSINPFGHTSFSTVQSTLV
ncbi:uncharacterized protein LACBIDRAFT_304952 [Laccaria bicolor S238N-H82]|uniref:Predicted protein n=1 Tax=Laccaria bicolor (strain S238N-H82 / ATCC MYA-4686) TaxID=486041 RepID=B0CT08_LACBS|nr:uncharacterized protein LACBIDRAFT_304952 [Laccaria bicolor S238N-H82]EDR13855.1 predicted protein [Laccaria bicolor S238N-H82]|eukprot:XP_001874414.1 predicted protein [Laccaria bicolor S238N-H82]